MMDDEEIVRVTIGRALSGYADDPIMANYADYGFCGRIAKPFALQDLAAAVQSGLGA